MYKFINLNEIKKDIDFRSEYYGIEIEELDINENYVHIRFQTISSENAIFFFQEVNSSIICSQNIFKPQYITNHIIEESILGVEKEGCIIHVTCNGEFDENKEYKR